MPATLRTNFHIFLCILAQMKYRSQLSTRWENYYSRK